MIDEAIRRRIYLDVLSAMVKVDPDIAYFINSAEDPERFAADLATAYARGYTITGADPA